MDFPSDASFLSLNSTKTIRVISINDFQIFTGIFRFDEMFYKFHVRILKINIPDNKYISFIARDKLFKLITCNEKEDTLNWRKRDFDSYFQIHPTYITVNCKGMDENGNILVDVGDFSDKINKCVQGFT